MLLIWPFKEHYKTSEKSTFVYQVCLGRAKMNLVVRGTPTVLHCTLKTPDNVLQNRVFFTDLVPWDIFLSVCFGLGRCAFVGDLFPWHPVLTACIGLGPPPIDGY